MLHFLKEAICVGYVIRRRIILNSLIQLALAYLGGDGGVICQVSESLELIITQDRWKKPFIQYNQDCPVVTSAGAQEIRKTRLAHFVSHLRPKSLIVDKCFGSCFVLPTRTVRPQNKKRVKFRMESFSSRDLVFSR